MAVRPYWTGQIRFALVSIPVQVVSATKSAEQISFHQIHEPSGKRIRYEKVVPGLGPVDTSEIVKGYEVEKGKYVLLTEEEIDDVKLEAKKVVDLTQFVDVDDIDPTYLEKPFFVLPDEGDEPGREAYVVLRDALRNTKKVGLGQLAVRGRSALVAVMPFGEGLLLEMLRYPNELRKTDPSFAELKDVKPAKELVKLAEELIGRKAGAFKPEVYRDKYIDALNELIEAKLAHRPPESIDEPVQTAQVIDLMEALKRSIRGGGASNDDQKPAKSKSDAKAKVTPIRQKAAAMSAKKSASKSVKIAGGKKKKSGER